jgi:hypothetical protein
MSGDSLRHNGFLAASDGKEGETAHSKTEAGERAMNAIRMAGGPANDLIAGTMASTIIPGARWIIPFGMIGMAQTVVTSHLPGGNLAGMLAAAVWGVIWAALPLRRPVYLIVTQGELICYRVPEVSRQPARAKELFRMPPGAVRVKGRKYKEDKNTTVRFASRGPGGARPPRHRSRAWPEGLRCLASRQPLAIDPSWHQELGEVLTALQAAGATIPPALLGITAALATAEPPQRD